MTALLPEDAAWLASSTGIDTDQPCTHYDAAHGRTCGATPTRQYIPGRRCYQHAPDRKKETR
ncbi:hypothetical protein ACOQFV_08875 [Nocardiopsis changdeensis]|uniref:Uncharacterized protein n=1 Tax=Nocardiopsis changdeensis TaxID=2831969 RepID=A0ABX8BDM1_9ACTN|nr:MULTISPECIES: hypothetical protein [Nocardiopsis]QUX20344.1 hypothetical protein KGD84_17605 [Nocardiopsis changdeensis]QYX36274.1 hypothetical protein K1J57_27060 [Nocardiopsis sp. MT53]